MKRIVRLQRNHLTAVPINCLVALCTALGLLLMSPPTALGQALFTYTFSDVVSTTSGLTSAGGTISGATFSSFTAVGTPANPNASNRFSFTDWSTGAVTGSDTFTGGINVNEYYEFSITPDAGFALNLDSITFTIQRSSTGIRQYSVRSDIDTYASNLSASISSTTTALSVVNSPQENIFQIADTSTTAVNGSTITLGTTFDALTQTITFRFYGWNAEAKTGTFSIDNVGVFGTIAPVVSPTYWDANGATTGLGGSGNWSSTNWSPDTTGIAAPVAFDSGKKAVFAGTAGNVSIGAGGVSANAGLRFETSGYTISSSGGVLTLGGNTSTVEVADAGHTATISAGIAGTSGPLHKLGAGTLELTGNNSGLFGVRLGSAATSAGATPVAPVDGGTLRINNKNALGANVFQFNAGTLAIMQPLTGANAIAIPVALSANTQVPAVITGADVEFSGEVQLFRPSVSIQHTLVVNTHVLFSGALNDPANSSGSSTGLTIAGTGSLTLAAALNTISELITVEGPTLTVNGLLSASSGIFVKGGTLAGTGAVPLGTLSIGDGSGADAIFAPGNGIATFKAGGLTLASDAVFRLEINSNLRLSDVVTVSGVISLGAGIAKLEITDLDSVTLPLGTELTIINNEGLGAVSGYFKGLNNLQRFFVGKNQFAIDYGSGTEASDVVLHVVPEPQSVALLIPGMALLGSFTRRRSKR
ncbi:beta strand repeat-containing protein [Verrucomicrobiota bacterium sgz303538]